MTTLLRLESLVMGLLCMWFYYDHHFPWLIFCVLVLIPDLSMFGYCFGSRVGSRCYNLFHTYVFSLLCICMGLMLENSMSTMLGVIWTAHIAFDRSLGFGLKYQDNFNHTHLVQQDQRR
ncbi:DUF4260 domain-containing protein [Alicyclobacillus fastidiosus]|uniref:DUF4260 domain-containing protein n=1 Tax=Alicyclobacillus fastidiosus TaxID=392011 RepID=A0ABV5ANL5_9BACL|nr:DUF4260 domain-containing protein [Alicyclobacillus fastidiosus]WEH08406.1 DUF4260 domain-containing protein [Alicyclobacillus fastidiosus]